MIHKIIEYPMDTYNYQEIEDDMNHHDTEGFRVISTVIYRNSLKGDCLVVTYGSIASY